MPVEVRDKPDEHHYEATVDDAVAGRVEYHETADGVMVLTHTEVDPAFEGQGVGGALARSVLDDVRARQLKVLITCPFLREWIDRHPDYRDMLYPGT